MNNAKTVAGIPLPLYLGILALTFASMYTGSVPGGMVGGFLVLLVVGEGLNYAGKTIPVVRTYLGGSVICILGGAILTATGILPPETVSLMDSFVNEQDFLVFYIAALITGSLFNIDRDLLIRASVKILPTALISIAVGVTVIGLLGMTCGLSFMEGILYIAIPMTSGGMTAGAVPLSAMYAQATGMDAGAVLTRIAPATVLGNIVAIILGALANALGKKKSVLSGDGRLVNDGKPVPERPPMRPTFQTLGTGLIMTMAFYSVSELCHHFVHIIPTYAWMIVMVVAVKSAGILSDALEDCAREWGYFCIHSMTAAALTGIGTTLIDLKTILHTLTPMYLVTVAAGVLAVTLTAAFVGAKFMGFYPLESGIAAGMCTMNMGGSGNVAVLSSAERMELLPFAQIVLRSCGALMLTLGGILIQAVK